jgi:hypothetical protein
MCWAPVTHTCNPSYSGGRDQEDGVRNQFARPYLKKPITKKGWWGGSRCRSEFKPQYQKKKKKSE